MPVPTVAAQFPGRTMSPVAFTGNPLKSQVICRSCHLYNAYRFDRTRVADLPKSESRHLHLWARFDCMAAAVSRMTCLFELSQACQSTRVTQHQRRAVNGQAHAHAGVEACRGALRSDTTTERDLHPLLGYSTADELSEITIATTV